MEYYDSGAPKYNTRVDMYMNELNEVKQILVTEMIGLNNKEIISIAHSIKVIYRGVEEKILHSRKAFEFLQKCMPLSDKRLASLNKDLNGFYRVKIEFRKLVELINQENFLYLLNDKHYKNRMVVFGDIGMNEMKELLYTYSRGLKALQFIEDNRINLFKKMVGFNGAISRFNIHCIVRDNGNEVGLVKFKYNKEEKLFEGTQYRLDVYTPKIDEVAVMLENHSQVEELTQWVNKFMPEYLI